MTLWSQLQADQMAIRSTATAAILGAIVLLSGCATCPARDEYASRLSAAPLISGDISAQTFFAAFEILPNSSPRRLELRSAFNTVAQARGHVVLPSLLVLDADLSDNAKYIVVHTDPRNVDREVSWHFSLYVAVPVNVGTESNSRAKVGVGGPMRVRIYTETN